MRVKNTSASSLRTIEFVPIHPYMYIHKQTYIHTYTYMHTQTYTHLNLLALLALRVFEPIPIQYHHLGCAYVVQAILKRRTGITYYIWYSVVLLTQRPHSEGVCVVIAGIFRLKIYFPEQKNM